MLTMVTILKAFDGQIGVMQRNTIPSWTVLVPKCNAIRFGDNPGTSEPAQEFSVRRILTVTCKEYDTHMVNQEERAAKHDQICYINADIIRTDKFGSAVAEVRSQRNWWCLSRFLRISSVLNPLMQLVSPLVIYAIDYGRSLPVVTKVHRQSTGPYLT